MTLEAPRHYGVTLVEMLLLAALAVIAIVAVTRLAMPQHAAKVQSFTTQDGTTVTWQGDDTCQVVESLGVLVCTERG